MVSCPGDCTVANPQHAVASEGVDVLEDETETHIYSSKFMYVFHIVNMNVYKVPMGIVPASKFPLLE